jgi:DNA-binding IclR family transcriptional regulator
VQSVEIAARILGCFSVSEPALGVTQIGQRLHMAKSKVHRFLVSLQRAGLVRRDPFTDRYSLGLRLYELGQVAVDGLDVQARAGDAARLLAQTTGQTASAAVWTESGPVLSYQSRPPGALGIGYSVGSVLSLHSSAHGKVFLAFLPSLEEAIFGTLTHVTRNTITDPVILKQQREQIRQTRVAVSRNESALGLFEVSSPVFGINGGLVAALGVVGLGDEVSAQRERELAALVLETATELSRQLGFGAVKASVDETLPASGARPAGRTRSRPALQP